MRKFALAILVAALAAGCTPTEQRVAGTAAVGAGTGAVIGGLANGSRGALVGTAIGGATGAVVGAATAPQHQDCWVRDRNGHVVRDRNGNPIRERC